MAEFCPALLRGSCSFLFNSLPDVARPGKKAFHFVSRDDAC
jgi:hypothetical protein